MRHTPANLLFANDLRKSKVWVVDVCVVMSFPHAPEADLEINQPDHPQGAGIHSCPCIANKKATMRKRTVACGYKTGIDLLPVNRRATRRDNFAIGGHNAKKFDGIHAAHSFL